MAPRSTARRRRAGRPRRSARDTAAPRSTCWCGRRSAHRDRHAVPLRVDRGVRVSHEGDVVPLRRRALHRRANAEIRLRSGEDEVRGRETIERLTQVGLREGIAIALLDQRLSVVTSQRRRELPFGRSETDRIVVHPHDRHIRRACALHESRRAGEGSVFVEAARHNADLRVDDDDSGTRHPCGCLRGGRGHLSPSRGIPRCSPRSRSRASSGTGGRRRRSSSRSRARARSTADARRWPAPWWCRRSPG